MTATSDWPDLVFDSLESADAHLVTASGSTIALDPSRWHAEPSRADLSVLTRAVDPVLDVGCGPGRHSVELTRAGRNALGIDSSGAAVRAATRRGARVMQACVFGTVIGAGTWASVLLLDGNIGIGGSPGALLNRCAELLRPSGRLLVEILAPGSPTRFDRVKVVVADFTKGGCFNAEPRTSWFDWATVSVTNIGQLGSACGFSVADIWSCEGRWFAELRLNRRRQPRRSSPPGAVPSFPDGCD